MNKNVILVNWSYFFLHGFVRAMLKEGQNYLSTTQPDGRPRLLLVEGNSIGLISKLEMEHF